MKNSENAEKKLRKALDTLSPKRPPGRPQTVVPSAIEGRADNYRGIFDHVWDELWPALSTADTEEEVVAAFQTAIPGDHQYSDSAALILRVLKEQHFPKRRQARIGFLADSIAGLGIVTPRRSRDICVEERARQKRTHHILQVEYYVVCSCGYKGPSLNRACRRCGAQISEDWDYP